MNYTLPEFIPTAITVSAKVSGQDTQRKHWICTIFEDNYGSPELCIEEIHSISSVCDYAVFGREQAPTTGKWHYQSYCIFEKKERLSALKKRFSPFIHWEQARAGPTDNYNYCTKNDKTPLEFGERPKFNDNGQREQARWKDAKDLACAGQLDDIEPQIYVQHFSSLVKIKAAHQRCDKDLLIKPCGIFLYGVPGSGKSREARLLVGDNPIYLKGFNKWWDGYNGEDFILLEDMDPSHAYMLNYLKCWTDIYPFTGEFKGGIFPSIRPKQVMITSNHSLAQIFASLPEVDTAAVLRRFKVKFFPYPYGASYAEKAAIRKANKEQISEFETPLNLNPTNRPATPRPSPDDVDIPDSVLTPPTRLVRSGTFYDKRECPLAPKPSKRFKFLGEASQAICVSDSETDEVEE
nr:MAG: replication associated protein [Cressdnaviricota sp.]